MELFKDVKAKELQDRIDGEIARAEIEMRNMDSLWISLELSDEERETWGEYVCRKYTNDDYWWEIDEDNWLTINFLNLN